MTEQTESAADKDSTESTESAPPEKLLTPLTLNWADADEETATIFLKFIQKLEKIRKINDKSSSYDKARAILYARAEEQVNRLIGIANTNLYQIDKEVVKASITVVMGALKALEGRLTAIDDERMIEQEDVHAFKRKVMQYFIKNNITHDSAGNISRAIWGGKKAIKFARIAAIACELGLLYSWKQEIRKNVFSTYYGIPK